jgi:hypothetical protein
MEAVEALIPGGGDTSGTFAANGGTFFGCFSRKEDKGATQPSHFPRSGESRSETAVG